MDLPWVILNILSHFPIVGSSAGCCGTWHHCQYCGVVVVAVAVGVFCAGARCDRGVNVKFSWLPHNFVFSTSMIYIRNHSVTWVLGAPAAMQILIVNWFWMNSQQWSIKSTSPRTKHTCPQLAGGCRAANVNITKSNNIQEKPKYLDIFSLLGWSTELETNLREALRCC